MRTFHNKKTKLKIHWPFVRTVSKFPISLKIVCYRRHCIHCGPSLLLFAHQSRTESSRCFYWGHFPCFIFFYPDVKNLKLCHLLRTTFCKFYWHRKHLITCWPLLKLPLAFCWHHMAACRWQWFRRRGGGEYSDCVGYFVLLRTSSMLRTTHISVEFLSSSYIFPNKCFLSH